MNCVVQNRKQKFLQSYDWALIDMYVEHHTKYTSLLLMNVKTTAHSHEHTKRYDYRFKYLHIYLHYYEQQQSKH